MALIIKNSNQGRAQSYGAPGQGRAIVEQVISVDRAAATIPATTTDIIFRVFGGRVLVKKLIGEVTTVIQTQADNMKVSSKKLDNAGVAVGTAVDIAANVDITGKEVGSFYFVEGDGTAGVLSLAGGALVGANSGNWIAPQGEIYLTTSATNTGAMKWHIEYQPIDDGAYVTASPVAVAI